MRGEPNFPLVAELASKQGTQLLQDADTDLAHAEPLIASTARKLEPLVGPTAAQGLALAKEAQGLLWQLQNKIRGLRQAVDRLKADGALVSEDAILAQLEKGAQ